MRLCLRRHRVCLRQRWAPGEKGAFALPALRHPLVSIKQAEALVRLPVHRPRDRNQRRRGKRLTDSSRFFKSKIDLILNCRNMCESSYSREWYNMATRVHTQYLRGITRYLCGVPCRGKHVIISSSSRIFAWCILYPVYITYMPLCPLPPVLLYYTLYIVYSILLSSQSSLFLFFSFFLSFFLSEGGLSAAQVRCPRDTQVVIRVV